MTGRDRRRNAQPNAAMYVGYADDDEDVESIMAKFQAIEDAKADIGWGSQIRSYVLDQSRVKDLRTEIERTDPNKVLDGDLDPFMEACLKAGH